MSRVLDKYCVKVIIDVAIFFEFSDENVINSDVAIQIMENVASELQLMDDGCKNDFAKIAEELSDDYGDYKDFVKNLPTALGIDRYEA